MPDSLPPAMAAAALAISLFVSGAQAEMLHVATAQGAREAIVLPSRRMPGPTVIVLHGATATAAWTARGSGFAAAGAGHGFTTVFPQGINRQWNDGREGRMSAVDDVGFLRQLTDELVGRGITEPSRIYIAGISNGGMMTFRMLCEASERFAGAATIIANMPAGAGEGCRLRRPVAIVMFNGTADPLVPYGGGGVGFGGHRGFVWGAEQTAEFIARSNGCSEARTQALPRQPAEPVTVQQIVWSSCRSGQGVALYRFEGGGHQLPGRRPILTGVLGQSSQQIDAAKIALSLFANTRVATSAKVPQDAARSD
jgi:polyhydroxybutyrate depolymerase